MKKMMIVCLVFAMLFSMVTGVSGQKGALPFKDVESNHFAYDAVQYFHGENVINGVGDDLFAPNDFVTREQFAKMISLIYHKEDFDPQEQTFTDVTSNMWSYRYIESVKEYLTGYYPAGGAAFFNPTGKATREDVAYALVKISGLKENQYNDASVLEAYKDSEQISVNLKEYVAVAVSAGLMQGYENYLRPQDGITRAEVATLLFRAIKRPVDDNAAPADKPEKEDKEDKDKDKITGLMLETDDILNISGYTEDEIDGRLQLIWSPEDEAAEFSAKLRCRNGGFDYVTCEIELTEVISVQSDEVEGLFDVKMDGKIRHDGIRGTIIIKKNLIKLNTEPYDYKLIASLDADDDKDDDDDRDDKYDDDDERDDDDNDDRFWEDADYVLYQVKTVGGDKATGYFRYLCKENQSKVDAEFEVGQDEFEIKMIKQTAQQDETVKGIFTVYCNDKPMHTNIEGTIKYYNDALGETAEFVTKNGEIYVQMQIVEKSGAEKDAEEDAVDNTADFAVVRSISDGLNAAGEVAKVLNAWQGDSFISIALEEDCDDDFDFGDIIRYHTNSKGEVKSITHIFDYSENELLEKRSENGYYYAGLVIDDGKTVQLKNSEGVEELTWKLDKTATNVQIDVERAKRNATAAFKGYTSHSYIKANIAEEVFTGTAHVLVVKADKDDQIEGVVSYLYADEELMGKEVADFSVPAV